MGCTGASGEESAIRRIDGASLRLVGANWGLMGPLSSLADAQELKETRREEQRTLIAPM